MKQIAGESDENYLKWRRKERRADMKLEWHKALAFFFFIMAIIAIFLGAYYALLYAPDCLANCNIGVA